MKGIEEVGTERVKNAIKELNRSGILVTPEGEPKKIKFVGVSNDAMYGEFIEEVTKIAQDGRSGELPQIVVELWSDIWAEEIASQDTAPPMGEEGEVMSDEPKTEEPTTEEPTTEEPTTEEPTTEEPEAEPTKPKAPPKADEPKSRFGHKLGTQAAMIDDMVFEGASVADMAAKIGCSKSRVKAHLQHLQEKKGVKIDNKDGVHKAV